jgi:hypothetical protein
MKQLEGAVGGMRDESGNRLTTETKLANPTCIVRLSTKHFALQLAQ